MVIDIIDLSDENYKNLSAVQLAMVRAAQAKKDKLLSEADELCGELFRMVLSNNALRSTALRDRLAKERADAQRQVEAVRADLLYQIAYEGIGSEGNEQGPYRYPENPNYNLSYSQRFLVVRNYYMQATDDPNARLQAFAMDTLAKEYLGEFYRTLYELLASYC